MDEAGRLVIPKDIRRQAGLQPGTSLEIRWHDGKIEIEPATVPVSLVREGRFVVAVPQTKIPTLTSQEVEETREAVGIARYPDLSHG